jgi:hypothetical protein
MKNKTIFKTGFFVLTLFPTLACQTSMVKRPEADIVKEIAIVSVYSNPKVKNLGGDGNSVTEEAAGWASWLGVSGNNAKKEPNAVDKMLDFGGTRFVEHGYKELKQALNGVKGWKVVDKSEYINKKPMQEFVHMVHNRNRDRMGALKGITGNMYTTVAGLAEYPFDQKDKDGQQFAKLAKDLGVDSVAILQLDVAYDPSTAIGGTGTATASVGTALHLYNRKGKEAVRSGIVRFDSEETTAMINGSILFSDPVERMFKDSITKSAHFYKKKINEAF